MLSAGNLVPADALILEAADCYVSESVLTGESFPVEKRPGLVSAQAPLAQRANCVFLGTNVRSGTLRCLVVATGEATQFDAVAKRLDLMTFAALLWLFQASAEVFRTGWFIESLLTELVIALVVRTRRPFFRSKPGKLLMVSTALLVLLALAMPYLPFVGVLGFVPLPGMLLTTLVGITLAYVLAAEATKLWFYRRAV